MNVRELAERLDLEESEYVELLELLVDSGKQDLDRLEAALKEGDPGRVAEAAHSLKGATANLGLVDLSEKARQIEQKALRNEMVGMEERTQELRKGLERIPGFFPVEEKPQWAP